jgi:hypothetical protein
METPRIFQSIQPISVQEVSSDGTPITVTRNVNTDIVVDLNKVVAFQHYVNPNTGTIDGSITQVNVEGSFDVKLIKLPFIVFKQFIDAL